MLQNRPFLKSFFFVLFWLQIPFSFAQLTTDNSAPYNSVNYLVQDVLMGNGITASGISSGGTAAQIGYFDGSNSNIGLSRGVFLSSGDISTAGGINFDNGMTTAFGGPGDTDLNSLLTTQTTEDVAFIQFDFVPIGDSVIFRYVFASEEYNEYVCSNFNDVFGFFITGPGYPPGGQNIALIPGGNIPVAINTINNGTPGQPGDEPTCAAADPNWQSNSGYFIDNTGGATVEFDGFTTVMEARAIVQCGETYTIKMAVGDAGDGQFDSGVFLEAESFSSPGIIVDITTVSGDTTIVEGCALATYTFIRPDAVGDITIGYEIAGNAINGVDYEFIPDSLVIPDGDLTGSISIIPFADGVFEGGDTVIVTVYNVTQCGDTIPETATILIQDENSLIVDAPDIISNCPGDDAVLTVSTTGGTPVYIHTWDNGMTGSPITVAPLVTDTFVVEAFDNDGCVGYDTAIVTVIPPFIPDAGNDTILCTGASVVIGGSPTGPLGATYSWAPSGSLSSATDANPTATPSSNQTYTVSVTNTVGCTYTDDIFVGVSSNPPVDAGADASICIGESIQLNSSGGTDYAWNTAPTLSDTSVADPIATPITTTKYYVTVSNVAGCSGIDSVEITVNNLPAVFAGNDTAICLGETVTIGGSPTGTGTATWLPITALNNASSLNPDASPTATTTYVVTLTDANNCSNTDDIEVTVNPLPSVDAGSNDDLCEGDTIQLSASGALTYIWTPADSISNTGIFNPLVYPITTTTYTVTGTDINTCENTDNVIITVNTNPTANAGNDITYLCPGASVQLNGSGGNTYVWSPVATLDDPNINDPVSTPSDTVNLELLVTDLNGCTDIDSLLIVVNDNPPSDAGPDTSICLGNSVVIGGNPTSIAGSAYNWNQGGTLDDNTFANPSATPIADTEYIVTVNNDTCTSTDTIMVTTLALPIISAGNDVQICISDSTALNASGGLSYLWTPSAGLSNDTIFNPNASPSDTTTYTINGTDVNGCSNSDQVIVIVNPLPTITTSGDDVICDGDTITINASGGSGYSWAPSGSLSSSNSSNSEAFPTSTTIYIVNVTDTNNCLDSASLTITVNSLPNVSAGLDDSICLGDSVQLNASGALNYTWSPATGLSSTSINDPWASPILSPTDYTVTGTDINGCEETDEVRIIVNQLPAISAGANEQFCIGDSVQLNATGGSSYTWSPGISLSDSLIASPWASPGDTIIYVLVGIDNSGCSNSDTIQVDVNPLPIIDAGITSSICLGDTAVLTATGGSSYIWTPADSIVNNSLATIQAFPDTNILYSVVGTDSNSCSYFDTVSVLVFRIETLPDTALCEGDSLQLQVFGSSANTYVWSPTAGLSDPNIPNPWAVLTNDITYSISASNIAGCNDEASISIISYDIPIADLEYVIEAGCEGVVAEFTNNSTGATSYLWNFDNSSTSEEENPVVTLPFNSNLTITLTATNDNLCDAIATETIATLGFDDYYDAYIPNVFTPNNDGENDIYNVELAGYLYECANMRIYNRWGQLMFTSTGNNTKWDGYTSVGEPCPEGVYYMTIEIGSKQHQSILYLMR